MLDRTRLVVEGLDVTIGTRASDPKLLEDLTFSLEAGQVLGIVGESGAGKSVAGSAIINLLRRPLAITAGQVRLSGQRIDNLPERDLRKVRGARIGYVFQDPMTSLNPVISIGKQLIDTLRAHSPISQADAKAKALEWIARVGLPNPERVFAAYPHEISGGQRQRVVIALALCPAPELIIADEPTTALDVSVQAKVLELLRELQRESGAAMILITHDLGVVAKMSDRIGVLYAGRLWELGPTDQVLTDPRFPYTAALLAATPAVDADGQMRMRPILGTVPRPDQRGQGCTFANRCPQASALCATTLPPVQHEGSRRFACHHPLKTGVLDV